MLGHAPRGRALRPEFPRRAREPEKASPTRTYSPSDDAVIVRADGSEVEVEISAMPSTSRATGSTQVIFRDVGQKRAAERAILRLNTELEPVSVNAPPSWTAPPIANWRRFPTRWRTICARRCVRSTVFATLLRESLGASLSDDDAALIRASSTAPTAWAG